MRAADARHRRSSLDALLAQFDVLPFDGSVVKAHSESSPYVASYDHASSID